MMPVCIKDLGQSSTSITWFQYGKKCPMHPQDILYHPKTHKEVVCSGFWVKGFKVKVDQDKSSLYLKIGSSLGLTNSWSQEVREMILGLGCHVGS